jgi:hypothetical protein
VTLPWKSSFPDEHYLEREAVSMFQRMLREHGGEATFCALSDLLLQWQGAYIADQSQEWGLKVVAIDELVLTGMDPEWNKIIIEQCARSPRKLREALKADEQLHNRLLGLPKNPEPIMVREEHGRMLVLSGMHRTIAAIGRGEEVIHAFVGRRHGHIALQSHPSHVYEFCRAYHIGALDKDGLVAVLRVVAGAFANAEEMFQRLAWEPELRPILDEALRRPHQASWIERFRLYIKGWL